MSGAVVCTFPEASAVGPAGVFKFVDVESVPAAFVFAVESTSDPVVLLVLEHAVKAEIATEIINKLNRFFIGFELCSFKSNH